VSRRICSCLSNPPHSHCPLSTAHCPLTTEFQSGVQCSHEFPGRNRSVRACRSCRRATWRRAFLNLRQSWILRPRRLLFGAILFPFRLAYEQLRSNCATPVRFARNSQHRANEPSRSQNPFWRKSIRRRPLCIWSRHHRLIPQPRSIRRSSPPVQQLARQRLSLLAGLRLPLRHRSRLL
jgi:hypothetical protein